MVCLNLPCAHRHEVTTYQCVRHRHLLGNSANYFLGVNAFCSPGIIILLCIL